MRRQAVLIVVILAGVVGWGVVRAVMPTAHVDHESSPLAPAPVPTTQDATAVWSGQEFLVFGGHRTSADGASDDAGLSNTGAAFDPTTGSWRTIPGAPIAPRARHAAVWTGSEMLVWGGTDRRHGVGGLRDGAAYDPTADRWRTIGDAPAGSDRSSAQALVVDGTVVIGAGFGPTPDHDRTVLLYDLADDGWRTAVAPNPVLQIARVGEQVVVLSSDPLASSYEVSRLDPDGAVVEPGVDLSFDPGLFTGGLVVVDDQLLFVADRFNGPVTVHAIDLGQRQAAEVTGSDGDLEGPLMLYGDGRLQPVLQDTDGHAVVLGRSQSQAHGFDPTGAIVASNEHHQWLCANGGTYAVDGMRLFTWGGTSCAPGAAANQQGAVTTFTWVDPAAEQPNPASS